LEARALRIRCALTVLRGLRDVNASGESSRPMRRRGEVSSLFAILNLRDISATAHFAVPRTCDMLLPHLRSDPAPPERLFARLKIFFHAAAGLTRRRAGRELTRA